MPQPTPTPPAPGATPRPQNLCPAQPSGADPVALLSWLFTPIFQVLFMALAASYLVLGDIGLAIVVVTILIRILLVPVFRKQIVSQRRMQLLQPELRAIQQKFKGNRSRVAEEQMRLYKERGVNPAAGCLPALLQLVLLLPMYQVFSQGLSAPDISSMLQVFGQPILDVPCQAPGNPDAGCINPIVPWLGNLNAARPEVLIPTNINLLGFPLGLSILAVLSAVLQLVQTRMLTPPTNDPQARTQQRLFLLLPLISILYGAALPAGLFLYWIVTTLFSIGQQYLIAGWGGLFPLFGRTPSFARNHTPRFPVPPLEPQEPKAETGAGAQPTRRTASDRAAGTIRPARTKPRTSRRGRRR